MGVLEIRLFQHYPNNALVKTLLKAFEPCSLIGSCPQARWHPEDGHIPRGFLGACAELSDVKAVLVFAEPSHPDPEDNYSNCNSPMEFLERTVIETFAHFQNPTHGIHHNTRWFLDQIWPEKRFADQLNHVWLTEGRLCSIDDKIGNVPDNQCSTKYLMPQLNLFPDAVVIPFGGKARKRVSRLNCPYLDGVYSLSPPGANHTPARPSWITAAALVRELL